MDLVAGDVGVIPPTIQGFTAHIHDGDNMYSEDGDTIFDAILRVAHHVSDGVAARYSIIRTSPDISDEHYCYCFAPDTSKEDTYLLTITI